MPRFSFFTSYPKASVTEDSLLWQAPIPLRLDSLWLKNGTSVCHADYFQAARSFLEANCYEIVTRAASQRLESDVKARDIEEIHIYLEKHGEFYHPCRIEISVFQKQLSFVLNVAVSKRARNLVEKEYHHLKRLNAGSPFSDLPQVYGLGRITGAQGTNFGMFLGEWFDGYHEFHISIDPADKKPKILVWDEPQGRFFLTVEQTKTLYLQASRILTNYYNLESFEQIFSWHHAAGDFIVKLENDSLQLKLSTVRRYAAIIKNQQDASARRSDPQLLLHALLVFLINLTIHMRLDRLDGIAELAWSDTAAIEATLIGFLQALSIKPDVASLPDTPLACFSVYLASCTAADLHDLSQAIVNRFNPQMPGLSLIKKNLKQHVETLYGCIQALLSGYGSI